MSLPLGKAAIITRNDTFEAFIKEQDEEAKKTRGAGEADKFRTIVEKQIEEPIQNSSPLEKILITRDDAFDAFVKEQANKGDKKATRKAEGAAKLVSTVAEKQIDEPIEKSFPPITRSELWDYRMQHKIFTHLEEVIKHTNSIQMAAFIALGKYSVIKVLALIASIAEMTFKGLTALFNPYKSSRERLCGKLFLKEVPSKVADLTLYFVIILIKDILSISICPKYFIWGNITYAKVMLPHAEANTIRSKACKQDFNNARCNYTLEIRLNMKCFPFNN
jgi:hypothetical protein